MSRAKVISPILAALVLLSAVVGYTVVRKSRAAGCVGVAVSPGQNIQALLDANPTGTTFCFAAGTYRLAAPLNPKDNQKLIGAYGAILNGAKVVTGFTASGSNFVATGFLPGTPGTHGECSTPGCTYAEDVFLDGTPLGRVTSLASLAPGKFFADYPTNKIYLRDNPSGKTVEQSVAHAIVASRNVGIQIKNFYIEKVASDAQYGAVQPYVASESNPTPANAGTGWVVENNEVRYSHGCGISLGTPYGGGDYASGGGMTITHNYVHHSGQIGLCGQGTGTLVEGNEIAYNNAAGYNKGWEAGGTKFATTNDLIVRGNYSHHNGGDGFWTDINNYNTRYENNYISDNTHSGIEHEISYDAVITGNTIIRNALGRTEFDFSSGILVFNSSNVEVSNNQLYDNHYEVTGFQQARENEAQGVGWRGVKEIRNLYVHDNQVYHFVGSPDDGWFGITTDEGAAGAWITTTAGNIRFRGNHHHRTSTAVQRFDWNAAKSFAQWQAVGQDLTGSINTTNATPPAPPTLIVGPTQDSATPTPTPTPGGKPADLNNDGAVNIFDLSILLSKYGQTGTNLPGDINHDNIVNVFDLSTLLSAWGT